MNKKILKERMRKMKNQKGITLVALIITIVVLLILAIVSIGAVQDSGIIAHAHNAAGGYNQAKNNEIETLATYEAEIEQHISGENSEYKVNLKLNTKYYRQGIENTDEYWIFYPNGTMIDYLVEVDGVGNREIIENEYEYIIEDNILEFNGLRFEIVELEQNALLISSITGERLMATSTEGLNYLSPNTYECGNKKIILYVDAFEIVDMENIGSMWSGQVPVLFREVIYPTGDDYYNNDGVIEVMTTTDNGETIIFNGEVYTKVTE